jgi:hypothetical protein
VLASKNVRDGQTSFERNIMIARCSTVRCMERLRVLNRLSGWIPVSERSKRDSENLATPYTFGRLDTEGRDRMRTDPHAEGAKCGSFSHPREIGTACPHSPRHVRDSAASRMRWAATADHEIFAYVHVTPLTMLPARSTIF